MSWTLPSNFGFVPRHDWTMPKNSGYLAPLDDPPLHLASIKVARRTVVDESGNPSLLWSVINMFCSGPNKVSWGRNTAIHEARFSPDRPENAPIEVEFYYRQIRPGWIVRGPNEPGAFHVVTEDEVDPEYGFDINGHDRRPWGTRRHEPSENHRPDHDWWYVLVPSGDDMPSPERWDLTGIPYGDRRNG